MRGESHEGTYGNFQYVPSRQETVKKKRRVPKIVKLVGMAVLFGLVSGSVFLGVNMVGNKLLGNGGSANPSIVNPGDVADNAMLTKSSSVVTSDVSGIVEDVMPSVVSITNMSVQQVQNFFGRVSEYNSTSAGTGIIIAQTEEELLIVTNYHVIAGSETLTVTFCDKSSVEADVKGSDSEHDIAVIAVPLQSISNDTMSKIAVATLGDSTQLKVGEPAIAIGNALGYGQSVTTGVISALDVNSSTVNSEQNMVATDVVDEDAVRLIQTDAAINPGNSGGALVNANGEVIGINSSKIEGSTVEGMGYAIPISDVSDIIHGLMNQKTKHKVAEGEQGYLGIRGYDVIAESSQRYNMPTGVYVSEVIKGGGAEKAGIRKGNIITAIGGTRVESMNALKKELEYYAKGEAVEVTIAIPQSDGEYGQETVEVTLGESTN
ncbi:MAG: trypsin-like serine protease [Ruminococcus sp.]|nr:trypsin-like serine protease [Ruminococcus sp.]